MKILALQGIRRNKQLFLFKKVRGKKQSKHIPKWFIDLMHEVGI
ncbi:unnamed protein product [Arabidopsis lyrata]|nr:unnamed protein product [Arabidopsis lyrata]